MISTVKDNVIIETTQPVEKNGLYLPTGTENIIQGKVIARGIQAKEEVQDQATILIAKNSATEIDVSGKKYLVVPVGKILAIID